MLMKVTSSLLDKCSTFPLGIRGIRGVNGSWWWWIFFFYFHVYWPKYIHLQRAKAICQTKCLPTVFASMNNVNVEVICKYNDVGDGGGGGGAGAGSRHAMHSGWSQTRLWAGHGSGQGGCDRVSDLLINTDNDPNGRRGSEGHQAMGEERVPPKGTWKGRVKFRCIAR